jgi:integrase/recombinase XerD
MLYYCCTKFHVMASIKIVLRKVIKQDGTSPLAIRITQDRKTSYVYLNYSVHADDWDSEEQRVKKSHKNSVRLNKFLVNKLAEVMDNALDLVKDRKEASAFAVRKASKSKKDGSVFAQAQAYLDQLEKSNFNRYDADKPRIKKLKIFLQHDIAFSDFSEGLVLRFKAWLKSEFGMAERTAINHLMVVRDIFSTAIKNGSCDPKYYPFGRGKVQIAFPKSMKIGAEATEVATLECLDLSDDKFLHHARNLWLFSFYFAGMRVSDLFRLKWSDFQNGRLYYRMGKNEKVDSLKVSDKVQAILSQYEAGKDDSDYVFPELKGLSVNSNLTQIQRTIKYKLKPVNSALRLIADRAGISKKLTMHISRHTFGSISGDRIPVQMLQKLYRHSNISTTIGYQASFINKDADDALDTVIGK